MMAKGGPTASEQLLAHIDGLLAAAKSDPSHTGRRSARC